MPKPDEVQAALDVLYLSKNLNWEFEQRMWRQAKSKMDYTLTDKLKGRNPSRYWPGWAKNEFDNTFRELVTLALEQAEKVRKGKSAVDVYKQEPERNGPTMKQKVRFIRTARGLSKSSGAVPEQTATTVDELVGSLTRSVYDMSSVATHVAKERKAVVRIKLYVVAVLHEMLEI
jgi:hypothetical protein